MSTPAERAETARQLREQAHALLTESGLFALLAAEFGEPSVTGSASYDLMVWRDIDIHLPVEADRAPGWMAFGTRLAALFEAARMPLHQASYINDWVEPGPEGGGLYWGLMVKDVAGNPWSIDIWGWDPFDYAVRQARDFGLMTDLKGCDRDLILRLKTEAWLRGPSYRAHVTTYDIYQFAIAGAGDSLGKLEAWKKTL
jgi:hypothetical protein